MTTPAIRITEPRSKLREKLLEIAPKAVSVLESRLDDLEATLRATQA